MLSFIRLQLKLKWGFNRNNNKASAIMTAVAALLAVAIALALVWALSFVLKANIPSLTAKKLSVLYLTIIMAGLTVAAAGMQIKRLYRSGDIHITARFPLSPFKLFLSYLIINYIDLCIYSAILLIPIMLAFGFAMGSMTFIYVMGVLLGVIFMPIIPFGLSIFIAVPTVYIAAFLEKHGIARLIIFIVALVGAFVLYYYILSVLAQFFIHKGWENGTLEIWSGIIDGLNGYYNPAYYLGNIMFFERFGLGFGVLFGVGVALIVGGAALARVVCANLRSKALEGGGVLGEKHSETDGYSSARAILRYSFKEILRTKTYSYFYLGVAISTPVMVFFCNRLVSMVGEANIGTGINFGASMLVVAVYMAMICSFTGSILSVEGKNFYITKLVPVSYRKQLFIKGLLNISVSAAALLISAVVLGCLGFLNAAEMSVLVTTQILLSVGLVFNGININLANPNLKPKANGEAEEINITYMLLIGIAIAAVLGACCIVFPRIWANGKNWAYLAAILSAMVYAVINILTFWFTVDNKYRKIEC